MFLSFSKMVGAPGNGFSGGTIAGLHHLLREASTGIIVSSA